MSQLYPLKFSPIFKDKIWGGQRIRTVLGHDFSPLSNCGEMWSLSAIPGNESVVTNGFLEGNNLGELIEVYLADILGDKVFEVFGEEFPLLLKIIDTRDYLSIQVHPDDDLAKKRYGALNGKTEMWVILDADEGAELISGFRQEVTQEQYLKCLSESHLQEILNTEQVKSGDVFHMPAGRVHAIGPGIMLAEIQQSSDITYRIYDWDRLGIDGLPRELHTELALEAIDFTKVENASFPLIRRLNQPTTVLDIPQFTTRFLELRGSMEPDYSAIDSFVVLFCTAGQFHVEHATETISARAGEVILIPAEVREFAIQSTEGADILEVFIP